MALVRANEGTSDYPWARPRQGGPTIRVHSGKPTAPPWVRRRSSRGRLWRR
jgi:hypothetical protein